MAKLDQRTIMRKALWFGNLRNVFRHLANRKSRRDLPFFFFEGETYTYKETWEQSMRYARMFAQYKDERVKAGRMKADEPLSVGMYLDNCPEFVFCLFGAAISGSVLVGANTGFRGDTLATVMNNAEITMLITSKEHLEEIERTLPGIEVISDEDVLMVGEGTKFKRLEDAVEEAQSSDASLPDKIDIFTPLIIIYTSGTTGAPKGVPCSHAKLLGAGLLTWRRLGLTSEDKGYVCMPMFHSNAWYLGIMPLMMGGGSFVLKPKFSASAFEDDVLEHGVTYLNYVGQPIHYILVALEKKYGSEEAIVEALANNPKNKFRYAMGNGAPPVDREKMLRYLNMEHIFELYGSTEAPINACLKPGDPLDSVGKLTSKKVVILDEENNVCPPAEVDEKGRIVNYEKAVGEICKKTEQDNIFFDGYFKNEEASSKKFRDGYFKSGDLGYVRVVNGNRYLYFVGRTDDWIRKDGENFSAESVVQHVLAHPAVGLCTAYGAPCEVADEKVMAAVMLHKGAEFDPQQVFDWLMERQEKHGMDPKWMPDFIRLVDGFEMTHQTQKILIRPLKRQHFNIEKFPDMKIFFRERGDTSYRELTPEIFEDMKKKFDEMGRVDLLYAGL